jgi:REP element-mobilizing transposase RayT
MTAETPRRKRLQRLGVLYVRSPIYFVTMCVIARKHLLANDKVHKSVLAFAQKGEGIGALVGRYVIMPDHLHLFVSIDGQRTTLPKWMKSLKNALSKTLRVAGVPSPHWQKDFFDHVLRSGESYAQKWNYVRQNPVRAGLVSKAEDWPFAGEIFPLEFLSDR